MFEPIKSSVYYKAPRQLNNEYSGFNNQAEEDNSVCPICGSPNFKYYPSYNQTLCECGCVIEEDNIDRSINGLGYGENGCLTHSFTTKSATLHDGGLSTEISEVNGKLRGSKGSYNDYRLRKTANRNRVVGNKERNLTSANHFLGLIKSQLGLSSTIVDEAARFYKVALEADEIHGRSIDEMVAASVYLACKATYPRSAKEISAVTNAEPEIIIRYSKVIKQYVNVNYAPTGPTSFIPRFVGNLNLPTEVEAKAIELVNLLDENQLGNGTQPSSYAAAAIYVACKSLKVKISQKRIVEACEVSETTIRKQSKVIKGVMN